MSATAEQIVLLRRLIAEPTDATYTDAMIVAAIESRPLPDARGVESMVWDYGTTPPVQEANTNWTPTYDLNAAAADLWDEKAAAVACDYQFSADGASYNRQQVFEQYSRMAKRFRARGRVGGIRLISTQRELTPCGEIIETTPDLPTYDYEALNV